MEKRIGTFYGVSVGPGDPELMTLQAVRRLENCPVIAAPQTPKGGMLALDIAKGAVDLSGKTILPLCFAMSLDPAVQKAAHIEAARAVKEYLDAGQDVAMLNLGDVSVYATFGYLQEILEAEGCKTVMLPGVTSFCAAAARLGQSLTGGMEQPLTIAPWKWISTRRGRAYSPSASSTSSPSSGAAKGTMRPSRMTMVPRSKVWRGV